MRKKKKITIENLSVFFFFSLVLIISEQSTKISKFLSSKNDHLTGVKINLKANKLKVQKKQKKKLYCER